MKSVLKLSIKLHFAILTAIISVLLIIGGHLFYRYEKHRNYSQKEKHLASIASLKSNQIREWYLNKITVVQTIVENPLLVEAARNNTKTNSPAISTRLSGLLRQISFEHKIYDVILVSIDGKLIDSSIGQVIELDYFEKKSIEATVSQGQAVTTDLFKCKHYGEEMIFISFVAALRDNENRPFAVLITRIDLTQFFYPLIESWPVPSQTAESYIFRVENDSVLYLNNLKHNVNAALSQKIALSQTDQSTVMAAKGVEGIVSGKDYRNVDVMAFVEKIKDTPWFIVSKIDKKEIISETPLLWYVATFVLAVIFLTALSVGLLYKLRQSSIYRELFQKEIEISHLNKKFKITVDSLVCGIIITDLEYKIKYLNTRAEEMTGWSNCEARGRILGDVYSVKIEEPGENNNNILEKKIINGIVKKFASNTLLGSKNGKEIPVIYSEVPVYDAQGSMTEIVIIFLEETEIWTQNRLLKESEKNFREFFENDITGDYSATSEGKLLSCNPAFAALLGFSFPEELIGRNIKEFYNDPREREGFLKAINESKILKEYNVILKHINGSKLFCKKNAVGQFDESGGLVKYFGYLQDITEQKHTEEKLFHREQLLASVLETQEELICRFLPDTTLTFVNNAYFKLFAVEEEKLIGRKFLELIPKPEWEHILSKLKRLHYENPQITYESFAFKADGSVITMEWTDIAIFNEEGKVTEIQAVGRDITEKKKTDKELLFLLKMNELLRKIAADFISLPLHEADSYIERSLGEIGKFINADRVYIFDYDWQLHTCSITSEWCKDETQSKIKDLQNVSLDDIPQWWNQHKQGHPLIVDDFLALEESDVARQTLEHQKVKSLITIPIMDKENCLGFVGLDYVQNYYRPSKREKDVLFVFADVVTSINRQTKINKEFIKAKEKADQSDKLKTAFINNISHEIRTPINGILGFGKMMAESKFSEEERRVFYEQIEKSSYRLINTVTDYLDMARLVSNTMRANKTEFVLESVFLAISEKTKKLCGTKNLIFELEIPSQTKGLIMNSDPEFLQKIFEKLLDNAIKFTKEGSIAFGYLLKTEHIEFFVKDTGIGIDDNMQESIFEIFRQADSSMTRSYEGSGLGLTIAKGLVKLLGGEIFMASEKGKGSVFTICIPLNNIGKSISINTIDVSKPKSYKKPLVLIAEDDEINYEYLSVVIKSTGYNYLRAANGKEAVDICRQNPEISIILMDLKMPVMQGDEATKQIRVLRPELPIIATTAYAQIGDKQASLEAGCNDYIAKPFKKEELLALINKYVG